MRDVLCEMDRRGQKTGAGFYDYDENRNAKPSPVTEKIIKDFMAKTGVNAAQDLRRGDPRALRLSDDQRGREDSRREEGDPRRPTSISSGSTATAGRSIAAARCSTATRSGLKTVVAKLKEYGPKMGADFKPSPLLEKLAAEGKRFQDLK